MATSKKKSAPKKKASKPASRQPSKKPAAAAHHKAAKRPLIALSSADRQSKLKPPENYEKLVEAVVAAWKAHSRVVRIDGRSAARLSSALKRATRARAKEDVLREKLEDKLRPLVDARIVQEEQVWSEVLDLYRVVKAMIPMRPELEEAFSDLSDQFARAPRKEEDAEPPPSS
jgi:hypothetical protein